jgi:hypothetical protein
MKTFFLFFFLIICNVLISAQIQITKSDVESVFTPGTSWATYSADSLETAMNVGTVSGSSQSWTIPSISWTQTLNVQNVSPASTPYTSDFPSANYAQYSTGEVQGYPASFYQYFRLEDNALYTLGNVINVKTSEIDTSLIQYHEELVFPLPLTYGTVIPVSRDSTEIMPGFYNIVTVTQTVDAFGSVTFPFGTYDALRIKNVDETKVYFNGSVINQYGSTYFTWVAKNGGTFEADLDTALVTSGNVTVYSANMTQFNATTSVEEKGNNITPTEFMLSQNYPNPFNPSTTIQYSIPKVSNVVVKVYDVLGNEVATLVDEYKEAGRYEVNFDASKLSSGIYFYKLQAGNFVETKKMILMK